MRSRVAVEVVPNEDVLLAEEVERSVGWVRGRREVARRFECWPRGHFVAREGGRDVGVVSVVVHPPASAPPRGPGFLPREPAPSGSFAWIGGLVVRPEARGRGAGRALMERAVAHAWSEGARAIGLDATEHGRPLYLALGFRDAGRSPRWERPAGASPPDVPVPAGLAVHPVSVSELLEVGAFDALRFGASRTRWLGALLADHAGFLARDRATGDVVAFAFAQERMIAPVVADSIEGARAVILACERAGAPARVTTWEANPAAEVALSALSYGRTLPGCDRMVLGDDLPMRTGSIFGVGAWAVG